MKSAREHAIEIIDRFYRSSDNLKTLQNIQFKKYNLSTLERKRVHVQTREILRWKGRIDWYIKKNVTADFNKMQTMLIAILELGTYEIIFDEKIPNYATIDSIVEITKIKYNKKTSGLVNAVLRKISKEEIDHKPTNMSDSDWYSFPNWLYSKWIKQFGERKTIELTEYFNDNQSLTIRRNDRQISSEEFHNKIPQDVKIEKCKTSDRFYTIQKGGRLLKHSDSLKNGEFSFQDRASGMVVEVLDPQPNETILDVCAAPGTKSNYIAELMENSGQIYASDVNKEHIGLAELDSKRLSNSNIIFAQKDATSSDFIMADRVLIDAPCTGTGTIGRRPDIKWRRTPGQLKNIINLQKAILNNVYRFVKPGGVLVYATCSLENEENWDVVGAFLKLHNDFEVISIKNPILKKYIDKKGALNIFPPRHKMDGMFAVKMSKNDK